MNRSEMYVVDEDHPIPDLGVVDVNTVKKSGGSDLFIVIATPLHADRRSLERLLRKIEVYLEFINSRDFLQSSGVPSVENTNIIVRIHPDSDARALELLERNKQWVSNNNANLIVDARPFSQ